MTAPRKDCWTIEDDTVLALTVLQHIRTGSTQLVAFDEAGSKLERTSAACGFRWNSEVRKHYTKEVKEAKHARMQSRKQPSNQARALISYLDEPERMKSHPLYPAIKLLNKFISKDAEARTVGDPTVDELTSIIEDRDREIEHLNQKLKEAKQAELAVTEDYMMLLRILERARALGVLNPSEAEDSKVSFKMDANGNLERIG